MTEKVYPASGRKSGYIACRREGYFLGVWPYLSQWRKWALKGVVIHAAD